MTDTTTEMLALADRIDATKRSWLPIAGHVVNVTFSLNEADMISSALRHLASQPSLYEAGLRDMRERAKAVAVGARDAAFTDHKNGIPVRFYQGIEARDIAYAIASLSVEATRSVDDLGSVQDALKMSTDGQPLAGLDTASVERETASICVTAGETAPAPSTAGSVREAVTAAQIALRLMWRKDYCSYLDTEKAEHIAKTVIEAALSAPVEAPVAWLRDVGGPGPDGQHDECYMPAAKGDLGAFPVYRATARPLPSVEQIAQIIDGNEYWTARTKAAAILTILGGSAHGR